MRDGRLSSDDVRAVLRTPTGVPSARAAEG
jgi:hypothetical protein